MFNILSNGKIQLIRGDSAEFTITAEEKDTGLPYEFKESDEVLFTVKKNANEKESLIQKNGTRIFISPDDTKDFEYGRYVYDVQLSFTDSDGRKIVDTIIPTNIFEILEEVTW